MHRPAYLTVDADQVSTFGQDLGVLADHNCVDYREVSTQGIVSSTNPPMSDQFGHASYLAASPGHLETFLQNPDSL